MTEKKVIIGHAAHALPGPHIAMPAGFTPLRLRIESERVSIEVTNSVAVIGRHSEVDLRFAYPDISRRHCRLAYDDGQWRVCDLKSLNGVYVNNVLVIEAPLFAGDMLRIGGVQLLVVTGTPLPITLRA